MKLKMMLGLDEILAIRFHKKRQAFTLRCEQLPLKNCMRFEACSNLSTSHKAIID
jgi:hypothetical protein